MAFLKKEKSSHYLTGKEIRAIDKANAREMKRLDREQHKKLPEKAFTIPRVATAFNEW